MGWDISGRIGVTGNQCTYSGTSMALVCLVRELFWWTILFFNGLLHYLESLSCFRFVSIYPLHPCLNVTFLMHQ